MTFVYIGVFILPRGPKDLKIVFGDAWRGLGEFWKLMGFNPYHFLVREFKFVDIHRRSSRGATARPH